MKIQIEGNIFIEHDGMQFIIKRYTGRMDKKDREISNVIGYYTKLSFALERIVQLKISESAGTTLGELLSEVRNIREWLHSKVDI